MRILSLTATIWLFSCTPDHEITAQRRELSTESATFDAGAVAVGDRKTLPIYLRSTAQGPVTIYDIYSDDEEHFAVLDSWKTDDTDGDGIPDAQIINGGAPDAPTYGLVELNFRPDAEEYFRTTLTIVSNDSEVFERNEEQQGLWRVVLRGIGRNPCANIYPLFHDLGNKPQGGYYSSVVTVENCGQVTLTISDFDTSKSTAFYIEDHPPIYVLPNTRDEFEVGWQVAGEGADKVLIEIGINDPNFEDTITAIGNDCEQSVDTSWDDDADGWFTCGGDCNDFDGSINPSALETANNSEDDNCDGDTDEGASDLNRDDDGDGWSENEGDCNDSDSSISPDGIETINQIDDNCDGRVDDTTEWFDDDGDGFSERDGDCNDNNAAIHPGAPESANNSEDDDCDGNLNEGSYFFDDDGDCFCVTAPCTGSAEPSCTTLESGDCSDDDPWSFPGAIEDCDGVDNDCDNLTDEDEDDIADGACQFVVDRATILTSEQTCAAVTGTGSAAVLALVSMAGILRRRRRS